MTAKDFDTVMRDMVRLWKGMMKLNDEEREQALRQLKQLMKEIEGGV